MEQRLLDTVVCPKCLGKLVFDKTRNTLICHTDKLIYAVEEGIPVLLESEALPLIEEKEREE